MTPASPLDSARRKAFWRLLPLLFLAYVIAYVDRQNVAVAKLTMAHPDHGLLGFTDAVIGLGAGIFFIGYFLLEIPGSLIVEKWGARKWICRIMLTWGLMAALTGFVQHEIFLLTPISKGMASLFSVSCGLLTHAPIQGVADWAASVKAMADGPNSLSIFQFVTVRFFLGLAEAGFFPGVMVYLTHWFPSRDRAKAIASFLVATPFAQIVSPKISNALLPIGTDAAHPQVLGMDGWQWVYVFWAIPALILGAVILFKLTDRPRLAKWLSPEERDALENELERERSITRSKGGKMTALAALKHPKVLLLALAYFCTVTASYGIEFFMPSILKTWYNINLNQVTWLILLPPAMAFCGQMLMGWSSDHFKERRLHAIGPLIMGSVALAILPSTQGNLWVTMIFLMIAFTGFKAYMPAFWSLPSMFLTETAAASSVGLINSIGNLGGFLGPTIMGYVSSSKGSFDGGLYYLSGSMLVTACIIALLGIGKKAGDDDRAPA